MEIAIRVLKDKIEKKIFQLVRQNESEMKNKREKQNESVISESHHPNNRYFRKWV